MPCTSHKAEISENQGIEHHEIGLLAVKEYINYLDKYR